MINKGGRYNTWVLFEYDPTNESFLFKIDFTGSTGHSPSGSLTLNPNGKLYGLTKFGGANNKGSIFEFDPK